MPNSIGTLLPIFTFSRRKPLLPQAMEFIDWLGSNNQTYWQILPINTQPLREKSPYSGYGIGLSLPHQSEKSYSSQARKNFLTQYPWSRDLAIFMALRQQFKTDRWWRWPQGYRDYQPQALITFINQNPQEILHHLDAQISTHRLWQEIKAYAQSKSVEIIGDLPFYIDRRSPLVWSHQHLFVSRGQPHSWTSGVPASSIYPRQVWNHPLYNWDNLNQQQHLWRLRLHHSSQLFDVLRIDHSIGFFHYGVIHTQDASQDTVSQGPGGKFFDFIYQTAHFYKLKLIAEDITDFNSLHLHHLLSTHHIPSSRVFTQGLTHGQLDPYFIDIDDYPQATAAYTSNHDTPPLVPWLESLSSEQYQQLAHAFESNDLHHLARSIRTRVLDSNAQYKIISIQDWLLSSERINTPGTKGNWKITQWPLLKNDLSKTSSQ